MEKQVIKKLTELLVNGQSIGMFNEHEADEMIEAMKNAANEVDDIVVIETKVVYKAYPKNWIH